MKKATKPATKKSAPKKPAAKADDLEIPKHLKRDPNEPIKDGTKQIHIRASNPNKKVISVTERIFNSVDAARVYLKELAVTLQTTNTTGETATAENGISLYANYDLRKILKGLEPKGLLRPIIMKSPETPRLSTSFTDTSEPRPARAPSSSPKSASGKSITGKVVVLKAICQELKIEPRKARARLRGLKKSGKLPREADGARWQWAPEEAEQVKTLLRS